MGAAILSKKNFEAVIEAATNEETKVVNEELIKAGERVFAAFLKLREENAADIEILYKHNLRFLTFIKTIPTTNERIRESDGRGYRHDPDMFYRRPTDKKS